MLDSFPRIATLVGTAALTAACSKAPPPEPTVTTPVASAVLPSPSASAKVMTSAGFIKANVDAVVNPNGLPAYAGPKGSVEGIVTVEGPPSGNLPLDSKACPASIDMYGKLFREGPSDKPGGPRPLADAVVVVTGYAGYYLPETQDVVKLTISGCAYPSRTLAVTYGQRLEIGNDTKLLFAPFLDEVSTPAIMGIPPSGGGEPIKIYPQRAGRFTITDKLQPFVREDLYVFRHPLHAVTDRAGHYRIDGVPVGSLKVGIYHPGVNAQAELPVQILENVVQPVDATLTYKPTVAPKQVDPATLPPWRRPND